jgi:hypothetical protein
MKRRDFEKLVVRALEGLPPEFQERLDNVDVVVETEPSPAQRGSPVWRRTRRFTASTRVCP